MSGRRYIKKAALMLLTILYILSVIPGIQAFAYDTSYKQTEKSFSESKGEDVERKVSSRFLELFLTSAKAPTKRTDDV